MVDFIRKRLQIFVSSTFSDLIPERQGAVEAILTAGHIPAGMELFTSGDESQMEVIKQWIDESDVYLLILGGRYGSVEPTSNKSYTQLEYEYAIQQSKPIFSCVITEEALEAKVKLHGTSVIESNYPSELRAFRGLALSMMVRFWDDEKDIKIAIGETLSHFSRREELQGWIRPHQEANLPALVDEIARLSKENSLLREELSRSNVRNTQGLSHNDLKRLLEEEELFDYLVENEEKLVDWSVLYGSDGVLKQKVKRLCFYGVLMRHEKNLLNVRLTDVGKVFLSQLKLDVIHGK